MGKYIDKVGHWTKFAKENLGVKDNVLTIDEFSKLIDEKKFLKKRRIYPTFSFQEVIFLELPKDIHNYLIGYLLAPESKNLGIRRTGYVWFNGYPVIYKADDEEVK